MNRRSYTGDLNPNWRGGPLNFKCKNCGNAFMIDRSKLSGLNGKYCSLGCYWGSLSKMPRLQRDINQSISTAINVCIKKRSKMSDHFKKILGYDEQILMSRMTSQFKEGMSLDNYLTVWQIDHIIPKSLFKFTSTKSRQFHYCWQLWNLRPEFSDVNQCRSGRLKFLKELTVISIDNGISGSIGVFKTAGSVKLFHTPVFSDSNYTKEEHFVTRIDTVKLEQLIKDVLEEVSIPHVIAILERPMVNPGRFSATCSALRSLEATLITLERLYIPYMFVDSKEWQTTLLESEIGDLKKQSLNVGKKLFPNIDFSGFSDADGLLIGKGFLNKIEWLQNQKDIGQERKDTK